jgi:hypothetical protein
VGAQPDAAGTWEIAGLGSSRGGLDRPSWQKRARWQLRQSTDRLMAPTLHTIEFALLRLLALGKDLSPWELSWTPRATGPGPAKPD